MEFSSADGAEQYAAVVRAGRRLLVALDFDGTLSPIVDDPAVAHIHPDAGEVLDRLAAEVRSIAVVTGRPARQVLALGGLDEVGDAIAEHGRELVVLGQYGNERWTSAHRRVVSPKPPPAISGLILALPHLLRRAGAPEAWIEEKGLAVAVHTRRLADPAAAFERLLPVLTEAARERGLSVEPGRLVVEIRASGMDKGRALHALVSEFEAGAVVFVGDDLGDVPAFEAVLELRATGLPTLLVCSGSDEESALRALADVEVAGPDGVMAFLAELAEDVRIRHA
ncbi:trehalose-phosphatase [Nocardioides marmoriginsengisoli]|uniref:Trehalose 6-phosphate phosphatase n=1 Tax=Nocardioides marmoriginsengisoli TaxID=661483 RepID=A0A3N0CRW4_9ACTN|nr:trehalose-phosphatase [Nocardioides marmoriginsengisoli]RNL66140.1 trehalose-phosphatase [Nocardioides marmoriginsengisoli]